MFQQFYFSVFTKGNQNTNMKRYLHPHASQYYFTQDLKMRRLCTNTRGEYYAAMKKEKVAALFTIAKIWKLAQVSISK